MTKRKKAGKKHVNQTAHQRAMTNPKTQAILTALRKGWDGMSPEQLGKQVIELISLECSVRGIADELGRPATTIRRCIGSAKSSETSRGRSATMKRAVAKESLTQKTKSAREVAGCKSSETPAKQEAPSPIKEISSVRDDAHSSTTQQTERITTSSSTRAQVRPDVNQTLSDEESRPGEHEAKTRPVGPSVSSEKTIQARMQRLADLAAEPMQPRPIWNANSMRRHGKP